MQSTSDEMKIL